MARPFDPSTAPDGTAQPVGQSNGTYFIVLALVGLCMGLLPDLLLSELIFRVVIPAEAHSLSAASMWSDLSDVATFLFSPCLFFTVLYLYGRRTARHFDEAYLRATASLFVGSAVGFSIYVLVSPYLDIGAAALNLSSSPDFAFDAVSEGVRDAIVGLAALGLAYLRSRGPPQHSLNA